MTEELVNAKIFFSGLATKKTAVKSMAFGIWLALFALVGLTIYRAFFMKTNQQQIVAKKGSNVSVTQINKTSRFLIPFIEVGVSQASDSKMGTFIKGGVRVEF